MMKHRKRITLTLLCIGIVITLLAAAGCGKEDPGEASGPETGTYEIQITGDETREAAAELLAQMNQYRIEQGMDALEWNDEPAEMLQVRAAELALNFSENRLDGTPGEEMLRGSSEDMEEIAGRFLKEDGFLKLLQDPENTSFCAGVFRSYSGPYYVAAGVYAKAGSKEVPSPVSKERTFKLIASDDALNCHGELLDQEMEPEDPKELYKGEGYYYCIFNENASDENNVEELVGMYAESSDPEVVTIDAYGDVTAQNTGTATLTVRPAKESAIEFVQEVEVKQ